MKELKFKKGEWCFHDFVLKQVMETEGNRITEVSCGAIRTFSNDLSDCCYPVDMRVKQISDSVKYWSNQFHEKGNNALNYPDLNRELVSRWCEMCDNKDNKEELERLSNSLSDFGRLVIGRIRDLEHEDVRGVRLFR